MRKTYEKLNEILKAKRIKKIREEYEEEQKILHGIEVGWVEEDQTKSKIGRPKNRKKKNRKQYGKLKKRKKTVKRILYKLKSSPS